MIASSRHPIVRQLLDAGILPANCASFVLELKLDQPPRIYSECYATVEQVDAISRALREHPEEARRVAHSIAFGDQAKTVVVAVDGVEPGRAR